MTKHHVILMSLLACRIYPSGTQIAIELLACLAQIPHRIIESQGWKGPTRSSSPIVFPLPLLPQATKPYLEAPHPDAP